MSNIEMQVSGSRPTEIDGSLYPWLEMDTVQANVRRVDLPSGETFELGSLISFSNGLTRIAGRVACADSETLQSRLLNALPDLLQGVPHANTSKVENSHGHAANLFVTTRHFSVHPFLLFDIVPVSADQEVPRVMKIATGKAPDYPKALRILGITPNKSSRRRNT